MPVILASNETPERPLLTTCSWLLLRDATRCRLRTRNVTFKNVFTSRHTVDFIRPANQWILFENTWNINSLYDCWVSDDWCKPIWLSN